MHWCLYIEKYVWFYLNWPGVGPKRPPPCLLAARDGAKPNIFWMFCRIDIVHRMYRNIKEHSEISSPGRFRWLNPWIHEMGKNGRRATTLPSKLQKRHYKYVIPTLFFATNTYMLLNMLKSAVNANPVANIDFILTNDRSRLLFFSFSSSRSIFFLCCLSNESPCVSLRRSTEKRTQ